MGRGLLPQAYRRQDPRGHCPRHDREIQHVSFVHRPGGSGEGAPRKRPSWAGLFRGMIRAWSPAGGLIMLALVLITAASALSNLLFNLPFSGEYELAKHF